MDDERDPFVTRIVTGVVFGVARRAMGWLWNHDPVLAKFAAAPWDDEPDTEEDIEAVRAGRARERRGEDRTVPIEEVFPEFSGGRH